MKPGEQWWSFIDSYWDTVDIYNGGSTFITTFAKLPEPTAHLLALQWCNSEVCNGGFHQFFSNATGVLAPEAANAYHAIEMHDLAELVEAAIAVFPPPYPREREERLAFLNSIPGSNREEWEEGDPFTAIDTAYYEAKAIEENRLENAADAYALRARAKMLPPPTPQAAP